MKTLKLDEFFKKTPPKPIGNDKEEREPSKHKPPSVNGETEESETVKKERESWQVFPENLPPAYLVSATYDGKNRCACLKLYEPKSKRIFFWRDNRNHKPYCLTNIPPEELEKLERLKSHPGFDHLEEIKKYDALKDKEITVTKVVAKDPLAIGGRARGCIRDIIPEDYPKIFGSKREVKVWEAAIKYYECYIFDQRLEMGMPYEIRNGELTPVRDKKFEEKVNRLIDEYFKDELEDFLPYLKNWARLLEYPAPEMRRVALDIEVYSPVATRVPDPREAAHEVICVSLVGSDGKKRVLLLRRDNIEDEEPDLPSDVIIEFYSSEKDLIAAVFRSLLDYPFVITFNGDDFDLRYLYHRALNLGFKRDEIPIEAGHNVCLLKYGIHIDLYRFFSNRSIQIYAFGQRYRNVNLDEIGEAIIQRAKIKIPKAISELTYNELARYCLNDAELTFELTSYNDDLVMKLILVLTRISCMPMEDVSRQGVSRWIRSFMQYEHRRKNMLIPNREDILAVKGKTATKAIIKGKKYKGAIVVEPVPGVHFNVAVMDFQSLYPSIIKVYNLGYQSILCPHKECRDNKVPDTPHWICKRQRALESALIGSLRDLRVKWYKPKAKDKSLPKDLRNWYNVIQSALKVILNASVDYEEPIILRDRDGNIHFMEIGRFVDSCIKENGAFHDGVNIISKVSGWETLSFNPETGKINFSRITHAIKHLNPNGEMLEITLQSGRRVKVSYGHSVFTLNRRGNITPVEAADLKEGDYIAIPSSIPPQEEKSYRSLNLVKKLAGLPASLIADVIVFIRGKDLHKKIRNSEGNYQILSTIRNINIGHDPRENNSIKRTENDTFFVRLKDLLPAIRCIDDSTVSSWRIGLYGESQTVNASIQLKEDFFKLLGYYVSSGYSRIIRDNYGNYIYKVAIKSEDTNMLREVEKLISKTFRINCKYLEGKREVTINSKILYLIFNEILDIGSAGDRLIPSIVMTGSRENKKAFLEGYFRGNGWKGGKAEFKCKNKMIISQLAFLLKQLGINKIYLKKNGGIHTLVVEDLYDWEHRRMGSHSTAITNWLVKEKENYLKYMRDGGEYERTKGDISLERIVKIRKVKSSSEYVYDLSVENDENFIGGYGLICLHNSYGVFGAEPFDLYCPPVAEATAAIGRNVITKTIEKAKELGIEVIYGDTDSLFLKNPSEKQIRELAEWSKRLLGMELEVDKIYRYTVLSSRKKNYLGVLEDGKVDVKGLTGKKRHIPLIIKRSFDMMEEILSRVKTPADFEEARRDVKKIVLECYMKLKKREWDDLNDLAFEVVLGKVPEAYEKTTPQHVKAALLLKKKGREIKAGDTIRFVKTIKEPHVKPVELATNKEIDVEKYIDYLRSTFDQVLDALGLEFDTIIGSTRLEQFMTLT